MKQRYQAAPFLTRETGELQRVFGVVDHGRKPFDWVRDKDGKAMRFASQEEARAWADCREHPGGAAFRA